MLFESMYYFKYGEVVVCIIVVGDVDLGIILCGIG